MPARIPKRARQRGFTLIELMIVIIIIGVLSTILFVAFGAIRRSQDKRNTRATLEVARSMLNEYVSQARSGGNNVTADDVGGSSLFYLRLAPDDWDFNGPNFKDPVANIDFKTMKASIVPAMVLYVKTLDFYNVPLRNPAGAAGQPVPMDVPRDDPPTASFGEIASSHQAGGTPLRNDWLPTQATDPLRYQQRWQLWNTMKTIRRLRSSPEAKAMWSTLRESQIVHLGADNSREDFIIDSWGRPLLFVPGSGVRGVQFGELAATNPKTSRTTPPSYVNPAGIRSADGRAFWMSAGPDGFYETQDDNLYSFDN